MKALRAITAITVATALWAASVITIGVLAKITWLIFSLGWSLL